MFYNRKQKHCQAQYETIMVKCPHYRGKEVDGHPQLQVRDGWMCNYIILPSSFITVMLSFVRMKYCSIHRLKGFLYFFFNVAQHNAPNTKDKGSPGPFGQ